MKQATFIKRHPSGILEGQVKDLQDNHAERLEKEGFVSLVDKGEPDREVIPPVDNPNGEEIPPIDNSDGDKIPADDIPVDDEQQELINPKKSKNK